MNKGHEERRVRIEALPLNESSPSYREHVENFDVSVRFSRLFGVNGDLLFLRPTGS